ncbi:MAG: hypothetical protein IKF48_08990 [Oscillospiraceae bacterium]|nr:hypothetical protein [Oscillospiraceae bacterium]
MDKLRLYIASALFVLLTVAKLLFPAQLDTLRREAGRLGGGETDYKGTVEAIGRCLSDRNFGEKLVAVFREYTEEETEDIT